MVSLFTEFAVSTALGSVLVLGAIVLFGAFLLVLVPKGPASSVATMAVGDAAGYAVLQIAAD
jgi:hypothetical protein